MEEAFMRMFVLATLLAASPALAEAPAYRITHTWTLGGDGRWDYITPDAPNHRVFIGRQNRVMVVDTNDGKLLGEITGVDGAHGVALVDHTGHGFATSGNDGMVLMFDLKTFRVVGKIPAAEDADAILYDRVSDRVFTFNGDAHSSTVVDPNEGRLVTNIPLGGKPESGASAGDGKIYVNLEEDDQVAEIDSRSAAVTRRWSTKPCGQPVAMAVDTAHHRLFSGCRSGVMAISDYEAGKVVTTERIGSGVDGAGFDPDTGDAFASNLDGTLTVIHQDGPDAYHVVQNLRTAEAARNMGLDPATHRIYVVSADFGPAPSEPTADNPRKRPPVLPGTFKLMVIERVPG
jgi:DNA-binding beta-propeller fold protein YncE